jgi:hypothetical protein
MDELRPEGAGWDRDDDGPVTRGETRGAGRAKHMAYPPTPDLAIARDVTAPRAKGTLQLVRPAWALALIVAAIALALMAVPQVRAAVVRVFQLGVVRIFVTEPSTPVTGVPAMTPQPGGTTQPGVALQGPITATPEVLPPPTALPSVNEVVTAASPTGDSRLPPALDGLAGQATLDEAQTKVPFPIALPAYPAGLGPPDYVFVQAHAAPVLILAWSDPSAKGGVGLSLWTFLKGSAIDKIAPETVEETTVDGQRALWTQGEHLLFMRNGDLDARPLVLGNTLIWERKDMTFRLETFLPLEEAVKVAESVR